MNWKKSLLLVCMLLLGATPSASQNSNDREFAQKVDGEFRLPVYDQQYAGHGRAEFLFLNHTRNPFKVELTLVERNNGKVGAEPRTINLPPGKSSTFYDINGLPNGEYILTVADVNKGGAGSKSGSIKRLLRHATSPACAAVPRTDMTGQKMYFPDSFYFSDYHDLKFLPIQAERRLVKRGTTDNDSFIVWGDNLFFDKDGRLVVNFHTWNRLWQTASKKRYHAVALDNNLTRWEYGPSFLPYNVIQVSPLEEVLPPMARPDWNEKPQNGKLIYRVYDPTRDGKVNLHQVKCERINPAAPGTVGYREYNWDVIKPSVNTVWLIWYKSPGEAIILRSKPLVSGFPVGDALEPSDSGSDLIFGQWLSDDGKMLHFSMGRHLTRYIPAIARYDNLYNRSRIIGIWRTKDGINWEQNYIAPPSDNKPIADQQYGGVPKRISGGAGLRVAFLNRYNATNQQISWELIYSWDGFRWTRFQDAPEFMPNGPFGDWFHGGGFIGDNAVERDGKIYHLMTWVSDHHHFQSEIVHSNLNSVDHITADYMKKRYLPRHLEAWPYFQSHFGGSWVKLAEYTRNATCAIGVAIYRADGFFRAEATGGVPGGFTTLPVTASGALKTNAEVAANGYLKLSIVDEAGKPIAGYVADVKGEGIALPVFGKLPKGKFRVRGVLKNAKLYTLDFSN